MAGEGLNVYKNTSVVPSQVAQTGSVSSTRSVASFFASMVSRGGPGCPLVSAIHGTPSSHFFKI